MPGTLLGQAEQSGVLSAENYAFLQDYIYRESGISLGLDKTYLLASRLQPLVEQERLGSLDELCGRLRFAPPETLRRRVVESMTTHETLFFRDYAVYEMLRSELLPQLAAARQSSRTLRIWSAACSSGQEPYSLAMLCLELGYRDWNVQILATDLSSQILDRAAAGRYLQIEVNRGLPTPMLLKYFHKCGADWRIRDEVKQLVRFAPFDLRQSMRGFGPFDLVLCRNVLIYFDLDTRKKILAGFRGTMFPGTWLLLGASETTLSVDDTFLRQTIRNSIAYQLPAGAGAA